MAGRIEAISQTPVNVLVVGKGAREDAIAWKIKQSPYVNEIFVAPGNGGTQRHATNQDIGEKDIDKITSFTTDKKNNVGLVIVGPEDPLALGLTNQLKEAGFNRVLGVSQEAARLESSKIWAVNFFRRNSIPHPDSYIPIDFLDAIRFIDHLPWKECVIKADGLAAGKGVVVPNSTEEAKQAIREAMVEKKFGKARERIVIQERLYGQEVSITAFSDGFHVVPLFPSQDHKRLLDNDEGPNTGGMGAYAPVPDKIFPKELRRQVFNEILTPITFGMAEEGHPFVGVLYVGLMLTKEGPQVLEVNVRFGDPEAQVVLSTLLSDLAVASFATTLGVLDSSYVRTKGAAVGVVLAADGYPQSPKTGDEIHGLNNDHGRDILIFHGGTIKEGKKIVTSGGRVLTIVAKDKDIYSAREKVYSAINEGRTPFFKNMYYRRGIAGKAVR